MRCSQTQKVMTELRLFVLFMRNVIGEGVGVDCTTLFPYEVQSILVCCRSKRISPSPSTRFWRSCRVRLGLIRCFCTGVHWKKAHWPLKCTREKTKKQQINRRQLYDGKKVFVRCVPPSRSSVQMQFELR